MVNVGQVLTWFGFRLPIAGSGCFLYYYVHYLARPLSGHSIFVRLSGSIDDNPFLSSLPAPFAAAV